MKYGFNMNLFTRLYSEFLPSTSSNEENRNVKIKKKKKFKMYGFFLATTRDGCYHINYHGNWSLKLINNSCGFTYCCDA